MSERIVRECDTCRAEITGAYYWTVAHSLTGNGPPGQSQDADREYCSRDCLIADQQALPDRPLTSLTSARTDIPTTRVWRCDCGHDNVDHEFRGEDSYRGACGHVDCGCPRPMYGLRAWAT